MMVDMLELQYENMPETLHGVDDIIWVLRLHQFRSETMYISMQKKWVVKIK